MNIRAIIILFLLCFLAAMSLFHRVNLSILSIDIMDSLSLTPATFGVLGSFTALGYALAQIPSGLFTDIFGAKKTLVTYQCLAALACISFSVSESLSSASFSRFVLGFSVAASVPAMRILADWFSAKHYSKATSILLSCGFIGSFFAASPLAFVTNLIGWRSALLYAGLLTLVFAALTFFILSTTPTNKKIEKEENTEKIHLLNIFKIILTQKNFLPAFFYFFFMVGSSFTLVSVWLGAFMMQAYELSRSEAGFLLSIMSISPFIVSPLVAITSDSIVKSRKKVLIAIACISFVLYIPLVFLKGIISQNLVLLSGILLVITYSSSGSILFTLVKESVPPAYIGTAFGMINTGAPLCSFFLQNIFAFLVGYGIQDTGDIFTGFTFAFGFLMCISVLPIAMTSLMKDTLK